MTNPKTVVILNGPPGSGKDECAAHLTELFGARHLQFKQKLFELVLSIFNIDEKTFFELYDDRETKEKPTCLLKGMSPRDAMIYVSEKMIKPHFGKDYFGLCAAENTQFGLNVFSDGGFPEELDPVYTECDGNMMIIRLHRPGRNYDSDSRNYIYDYKDIVEIDLHNDSDLDTLFFRVTELVDDFLAGEYHE